MRLRRHPKLLVAVACGAALATALAFGGAVSIGGRPYPLTRMEMTALLKAATAARAEAAKLAATGTGPTCPPPAALPPPQYPNGHQGYGVPFLAAIDNVAILSDYNDFVALHESNTVGTQHYDQNPWEAHLSGITGWVTGYLELPSLTGSINAADPATGSITFCLAGSPSSAAGIAAGAQCESAAPPAGQCLSIELDSQFGPGYQPSPHTINTPMAAVASSGPGSLAPGASAQYTFSIPSGSANFGEAVAFTGLAGGHTVTAAGGGYYVGYPYDAFPNQQLALTNLTVNGKPATYPGPTLAPGSTYTVAGTVTNQSSVSLQPNLIWTTDSGVVGSTPGLPPGHSAPFSVTGTVPAGQHAVGVYLSESFTGTNSTYSAFDLAYMQGFNGTAPVPQLEVSNPVIDGQSASSAPGPEASGETSQLTVTVTNHGSSKVSLITGTTPALGCLQTVDCTPYFGFVTPQSTTLQVAGVDPAGSGSSWGLRVTGTAASTVEICEVSFLGYPCVTGKAPDVVGISSYVNTVLPDPVTPDPSQGAPTVGNPNYTGEQVPPTAVTGPLVGGSGTVAGNDFEVPAFVPVPTSNPNVLQLEKNLVGLFNNYASGQPDEDPHLGDYWFLHYPAGNPIAGYQGWGQFSATAQIVKVGLPEGPPPNFTF